MSPPIRDGSGSSIAAIRLGDGSEISEVRTGAGDVLFSGSAIPDARIADFERANPLTDYTDFFGSTSFSVATSSPLQGAASLQSQDQNANLLVTDSAPLGQTASQGSTFSCLVTTSNSDGTPHPCFGVGAVSNSNGSRNLFYSEIDISNDEISIGRFKNGSRTLLKTVSANISTSSGQVYEHVITWNNNDSIVFEPYEFDTAAFNRGQQVGSVSVTDSTHSGNTGFGFETLGNGNGTDEFDWFVSGPGDGQYGSDPDS